MVVCIDDGERVRRLAELALVEAPLDPLLQQICDLASAFFPVPMAFIALVDATQTHVVAASGLERCSIPRENAFCNITIRQDEPLVIPDAHADPRYRHNQAVVGGPNVRLYVGIPLSIAPGVRVGSLCIADTKPRTLTDSQIKWLQGLASVVIGQFAHHASRRELAWHAIELARRQAILSQTERFAKVGGFEADNATGVMTWSDELYRLTAIDRASAPTLETFLSLADAAAEAGLRKGFASLVADAEDLDFETRFDKADGARRDVRIHAEMRTTASGDRKIVGIVQDITERKNATARLQWIATHDSLTKLCNRPTFNEHIEAAVRRAAGSEDGVALLVLDIDRFKFINDTLGHDAGDAVLVAVAERLTGTVGPRGIVARIGGDEFAVLVGHVETEGGIATLATDILLALRQPLVHRSGRLNTRATLGVALSSPDTSSADALFKNADIALYSAKKGGRDGFAFYRPVMREEMEGAIERLSDARVAVMAGHIKPYYQPKICLETGEIQGFEALLRWHHPTKGLCAPADMGDAFADTEVAVAIGRRMLDHVVKDILDWRGRKTRCGPIAINVAEPEFYAGDYAERLLSTLALHGLPPAAIEVEITESVFLGHRSGVIAKALRKLADAGISIALDDFGTGFASLTHLKRHPIASIKIDRSFVADIENDEDAAKIVDAVTSLANSLKIGVVAEGVETQAQVAFLRARHCAVGQGFLFAKPMPGSRVPHFVQSWSRSRQDLRRVANG